MDKENETPAHTPRQGWEEQFRQLAESGDDALLDADASSLTEWDETEWEWSYTD